jgi:acyl-CoA synthetase (AMP-forming)/AMP-acid ligase II
MAEFRENEPSVLSIRVLADIPRHQAMQRPHAVALSYEGKETTYQELNVASNLVASGLLAAGLKPSSRVAILDKNTDRFFEIWLGAAKVNAVLVPINARLAAPEVEFILNDAEVEVLFIGDSFLELFAKIREELASVRKVIVLNSRYAEWRNAQAECDPDLAPEPDDVCIQLYTSGTTGHPKGVQLTSKNLIAGLFSEKPRAALGTWMAEDVLLLAMPLSTSPAAEQECSVYWLG